MAYDLSSPGGFYWGSLPPEPPPRPKPPIRSELSVIERYAELTTKPRVKVKTG